MKYMIVGSGPGYSVKPQWLAVMVVASMMLVLLIWTEVVDQRSSEQVITIEPQTFVDEYLYEIENSEWAILKRDFEIREGDISLVILTVKNQLTDEELELKIIMTPLLIGIVDHILLGEIEKELEIQNRPAP